MIRFLPVAALGLSLALSACSLLPAQGRDELPIPALSYERFVLDNGLTLIVHEDRATPIVAVNVWYHVGSKNEAPGRTGFAHLFEHLMFNGSENYNDEFFRPLEAAGATGMNGTTNADRTNYFANVPTPALDTLLWLESDRMGHLLGVVDQARLDEQRGVVQNEKRQRENQPYGKVWDHIARYSYPQGHPYSWSTIGSMEDLEAATLDDVRHWFNTWYGAANAVIVIAGDISPQDARAKVEHYFGDIPAGPRLDRPRHWPAPMDTPRHVTVEDKVPQARSYFVWNIAPNYSEDLIHLQLAADALANGKNSRLYKALVHEAQTATDVGAYVAPRELGSQLIVWVTAKPEADIEALEREVIAQRDRLLAEGLSPDELERSRTGLYVGFIRGMEKLGGFGGRSDLLASSQVLTGRPDAWRDELAWLRGADTTAIRDTARRWLGAGHLSLRVVPREDGRHAESGADRSRLPEAGAGKPLELPPLQRASLSNGLPVVLAERHGLPLVEMRLISRGGYASDPAGQEGLASLAMSLLDEGTQKRDGLALAAELERLGAHIGSGASLDHSTVSLSALRPRLEPALDLYAEVIRQPSFPQDELDRLRPRLLAGIAQEQANPFQLGLRILPPLLYGDDHPYGAPLTGSGYERSLKALDRGAVVDFHARRLRPDNSQLLVVGAISMAELLPQLEARFGDWASETDAAPPALAPVALPGQPRIFLLDRPGSPQSVILAGHLAPPPSDPADLAMTTANTVFGGMFTSRINMNLREDKHWSYGAGSTLIDALGQRPFLVYSRVQADRTVDAMRETLKELKAIRGGRPIQSDELDTVVRQRTLSLPGRHETLGQLAGSLGHLLTHGLPDDYYETFVTELNAMTVEAANQGARSLIQPEALTWVVIGDLAPHREALRKLGWGPVAELDPQQQ